MSKALTGRRANLCSLARTHNKAQSKLDLKNNLANKYLNRQHCERCACACMCEMCICARTSGWVCAYARASVCVCTCCSRQWKKHCRRGRFDVSIVVQGPHKKGCARVPSLCVCLFARTRDDMPQDRNGGGVDGVGAGMLRMGCGQARRCCADGRRVFAVSDFVFVCVVHLCFCCCWLSSPNSRNDERPFTKNNTRTHTCMLCCSRTQAQTMTCDATAGRLVLVWARRREGHASMVQSGHRCRLWVGPMGRCLACLQAFLNCCWAFSKQLWQIV